MARASFTLKPNKSRTRPSRLGAKSDPGLAYGSNSSPDLLASTIWSSISSCDSASVPRNTIMGHPSTRNVSPLTMPPRMGKTVCCPRFVSFFMNVTSYHGTGSASATSARACLSSASPFQLHSLHGPSQVCKLVGLEGMAPSPLQVRRGDARFQPAQRSPERQADFQARIVGLELQLWIETGTVDRNGDAASFKGRTRSDPHLGSPHLVRQSLVDRAVSATMQKEPRQYPRPKLAASPFRFASCVPVSIR